MKHIFCFLTFLVHLILHRRTGRRGRGAAAPPPGGGGGAAAPSLVRNVNYSGNFYLRVGQSSCSGFVSLIFLIFSFHLSLAPCQNHTKTPHQNAGNGIKETLFFKIFLESMPLDPPRGSRAFGASRANSCPRPPNF